VSTPLIYQSLLISERFTCFFKSHEGSRDNEAEQDSCGYTARSDGYRNIGLHLCEQHPLALEKGMYEALHPDTRGKIAKARKEVVTTVLGKRDREQETTNPTITGSRGDGVFRQAVDMYGEVNFLGHSHSSRYNQQKISFETDLIRKDGKTENWFFVN